MDDCFNTAQWTSTNGDSVEITDTDMLGDYKFGVKITL
jgi:hypothetical protein